MMSEQVALEDVLRRALARAGIVEGYQHTCRAKGCEHVEAAPDNALRRCPVHGHKLWPKPVVRPIRFHDLRHTTASLMMMAGASLAAVGKILGHSNIRITAEVYGHLAPDYLSEVNRLSFGLPAPVIVPVVEVEVVHVSRTETAPSCAYSLPTTTQEKREAGTPSVSREIPASCVAGSTGLEPVASGVTVSEPRLAGIGRSLQPVAIAQGVGDRDSSASPGFAAFSRPRVTPGLQSPSVKIVPSERLLSVRQVAAWLGVSTSTIYGLCRDGKLPHVRVSNAIRLAPEALEELVGGGVRLTEPLTVGVVSSPTSRRGVAEPREPRKASKKGRAS